jgi:hypothetical protein
VGNYYAILGDMPYLYPAVQWVIYEPTRTGLLVACQVCGGKAGPLNWPGLHQFALQHREHVSTAPTHFGAGDVVAAATKALGMQSCSPCEQRRMTLNRMMPRVWRRR